jgi:hypothetical protein
MPLAAMPIRALSDHPGEARIMLNLHVWLRKCKLANIDAGLLGEYHESVAGSFLEDKWKSAKAGCTAQEGKEHGAELYAS